MESRRSTPGGHLTGESSLGILGLTLGTHYDRANGSELAGVDFSIYEAIAIASSFGGKLTRAELDALIARSADIKNFINAGGACSHLPSVTLNPLLWLHKARIYARKIKNSQAIFNFPRLSPPPR